MSLSLGIDVGTSGIRTAVMDGNTLVSMARADHWQQDPAGINASDWWTAVAACLDKQVNALRDLRVNPKTIAAIAVDGTSGSMILTDAHLNPVSPALMYNSKGFVDEAKRIDTVIEGDHIVKGNNSSLARAMRLISLAYTRPVHLLHQADFITAKLIGQGGRSDFNNALKTGFDPEKNCWPDWLAQLIDPTLLPKVHSPGAALEQISSQVAEQFGLSKMITIHAGTTDSIAAFLASAPITEGVAVTSLGSTLAIKFLCKQRIDDPKVGLYSHRLGPLWLVGGASNTGGAVLRAHFTDDELIKLSAAINPQTPLGLDYYPLNEPGERFPINDPNLQPRLCPRPDNKTDFLQAILEGIATIEARCYVDIEARVGARPSKIYTAGGGAKNPTWTAIRERALGQKPRISQHSEAAIGVAKLASSQMPLT